MMSWANDGWSWWAWLLMGLGMVAVWALIVWAVVFVVRTTRRPGEHPGDGRVILDERLARREIDEQEYHTRRDALREAERRSTPSPGR